MMTYLGYWASFPNLRNGLIVLGTIAALNMRAVVEERFLRQDSTYEEYFRRVPWRFVPRVY
jgi:protein-S-isoprenylcysteine O-methyltransferase Ste14